MTFVVTEACIKCKYTDCVEVCPVDCFHEGPNMLVIDPEECIDCGACVPACPVAAIYDSHDSTPASQKGLIPANDVYRNGDADTIAKAEAIVAAHVAEDFPDVFVRPKTSISAVPVIVSPVSLPLYRCTIFDPSGLTAAV